MERTFANGAVKPCCQDAGNLEVLADESREGLTVRRCRVCGCRHRRMVCDPGAFGVRTMVVPRAKAGA